MKHVLIGLMVMLATIGLLNLTGSNNTVELYKLNAPFIVRVKIGNQGWGTGVLTRTPSGSVVVITNNHVCYDLVTQKPKERLVAFDADSHLVSSLKFLKTSIQHDLCALGMYSSRAKGLTPSDVLHTRFTPVHTLGYPRTGRLSPSDGYILEKAEVVFPFLTQGPCPKGTASSLRSPASHSPICIQQLQEIALTNLTYPGNSGSLVFDDTNRYIGIISLGDDYTHTGLFVPALRVIELIKDL